MPELTLAGPPDLGWAEVGAVRVGLALLALLRFPARLPFPRQPYPVGLARLIDLTFLSEPPGMRVVGWVVRGAVAAYALGVGLPLATAVLALSIAAVGALRNSQGGAIHEPQAVGLVFLAQTVAFARFVDTPALWTGGASPEGLMAQRTALFWSQQALIAVYLTSGVTKIFASRGRWAFRAALAPLQVAKAAEQAFVRTLDARGRDRRAALAAWMAAHSVLTRLALACGLAVELASPLFLLSPAATFAGGSVLLAFHWAAGLAMGLPFWTHQALVMLLLANPLFVV
jgi:hypothetical protein